MLRRLIVIQGDTEPASVEQQRHLGKTAPSLYDMRNLFQVNVEEGRHLWAMVYLLQKYFGRDGREEADDLLRRRSGDADAPRMLGAFNEATPDWLSFFMFTYFTDRDGKMQLQALAQSGFDPLSRTCRFMLTEEAHHMFVGETGISRVVQRTCEAMKEAGIEDPTDIAKVRALGVIDLPTIQKKLNLHYTLSLDLFGSEVSTNAANAFNAGVKGRYRETQIEDDHRLENDTYPVLKLVDGEIKRVDEPALTALNMRLRDDYTQDCVKGLLRWNKIISLAGYDFKLALPNVAFHRQIGEFKDVHATPDGVLIDDATWDSAKGRMAALRRRRFHRQPDEAGDRDRQVRLVDFAAEGRHRQQAGRFRIREDRNDLMRALPQWQYRAKHWWLRGRRATTEQRALLRDIGALVRNERAKRGMTRKDAGRTVPDLRALSRADRERRSQPERAGARLDRARARPRFRSTNRRAAPCAAPAGVTPAAPAHRADRPARRRQVDARRGAGRKARCAVHRDRQDDRAGAWRAGRDAVRGLWAGHVPPLRTRMPGASSPSARAP